LRSFVKEKRRWPLSAATNILEFERKKPDASEFGPPVQPEFGAPSFTLTNVQSLNINIRQIARWISI